MKHGAIKKYPEEFVHLFDNEETFDNIPILPVENISSIKNITLSHLEGHPIMRGITYRSLEAEYVKEKKESYAGPFIAFCLKVTFPNISTPEMRVLILYLNEDGNCQIFTEKNNLLANHEQCLQYCKLLIQHVPCTDSVREPAIVDETCPRVELIDLVEPEIDVKRRRRCHIS